MSSVMTKRPAVRASLDPPQTRAATKQATRAALIAAGLAEFDGRGLDASLDSICERAGLTRGAFYVHFADRDAFIVAVMQHVLGEFVTSLAPLAEHAGADTMIEAYFAAVRARSPVVAGGRGLRMQHLLEACRRSPAIGTAYRGMVRIARDRLATLLAMDQMKRRVRTDVAATAIADLLVVASLGVPAMFELELERDVDPSTLGDTMLTMIRSQRGG
jgi:TetR/AcrR family transcriptional regulator, transcriptional repressor for nem operon